jgi:hypothetical protein
MKNYNQIKSLKAELKEIKQNLLNPKLDSNTLKNHIIDLTTQFAVITALKEGEESPILKAININNTTDIKENSLANKIKVLYEKSHQAKTYSKSILK